MWFLYTILFIPIGYYVFITALTWKRRKYIEGRLTLIMGKAGSGKSTMSGLIVKKANKQGRLVYSNHHVLGAIPLVHTDLGQYDLQDVDIIIDEGQLYYDSRCFKTFSEENKFFFSHFRHFGCRVFILSQSFEDLDVKIRRQAQHMYICQPFVKGLLLLQKIRMKFGVSEDESDIITLYKFNFFGYRIKLGFLAWKYFNSYSKPNFPQFYSDVTYGDIPKRKSIMEIPKKILEKRNYIRSLKIKLDNNEITNEQIDKQIDRKLSDLHE